ncbi:multicopy suppressor of BFA (Brefeldin A) [Diaporthe australafricana]|uniref:Multicopy suppressor of BFA (Brefeldin A) n=1 Tax=Diaporthe australafricana TaxID=127596 RepID=A0ABR3VVJ7_9PEZI
MADTAAAAAPAPTKPTKPDEALYKENLAKAEKEHTDVMTKYNAIKHKIELASPNKNSDNPTAKRRSELLDQLKEIRTKQGAGKNSRTAKLDQIKRLDEQLKARNKELKATKDLAKYDSEEKLDAAIQGLRAEIGSGKLKLVEEKQMVQEIDTLTRSRKQFGVIKEQQKGADDLRAKIQEIKDGMNDPEAKELSEKYTSLQTELDAIKAEQDEAYKGLSSLRDERTKLQAQQREKFETIKKIKDEYYGQRKAFQAYDREQKQKAWERSRAERERIEKERKLERAQKMLTEASDPAFLDEIRRANSLLQYFDPSFVAEKAPLQASTNLQAQADRKVDGSDIKGTKILSKKDREEDFFPAQKKGKKGKKHNATATKSTFNCPPSVLEDCSYLGIDPPMSADEVPGVVEKTRAKLDQWKSDQATQTQKNIEKAKKEIEKIEAEEAKEKEGKKSSPGPATPNGNGAASNGETSGDKVEEVTEKVEKATIEDKEGEAVAAA